MGIRQKIGRWASGEAFAYYQGKGTYKGLPHDLEILVSWGYKGYPFWRSVRNSFSGKGWVRRK